MMNYVSAIRGVLRRAIVNLIDDSKLVQAVQVSRGSSFGGELVSEDVENMAYPPGIRFVPAGGCTAVLGAPSGQQANSVVLALADPANPPPLGSTPGTGGLFSEGLYRVFLDADGNVILVGDSDSGRAATDAAVVDSKLQTELARLKAELDAVKTDLTTVKTAIAGAVVQAGDGGATFKTNIGSALASYPAVSPAAPGATASTKVLMPPD